MFLPHLDYGIIIWSNCGELNLNKLQKLQNTAMRVILGAPYRTHINDMLRTLGFMDVRSRISYVTGHTTIVQTQVDFQRRVEIDS